MMKTLKYTSGLLLLTLLVSPPASAQQDSSQPGKDDSRAVQGSRVRGPRIGYDLASLALLYFEPERMIYTVSVDYEAWQDIYPVIEGGYQHVGIEKDIYRYTSSGLFIRAGVDVNLMQYEQTNVYEMIYGGLRYGFSNFSQKADEILIREDYFGDLTGGSVPENRINAHWISLVGGVRIELFRNVFMGWSVLGNLKLAMGDDSGMVPYNIPGFGPGDKRASIVINYSLAYRFPLQSYHPRKIIKRGKNQQ
jgi:hypothetical protein